MIPCRCASDCGWQGPLSEECDAICPDCGDIALPTISPVRRKQSGPRQPRGRPITETLVTVTQAAAAKGVSPSTIRCAIREGRIPAFALGSRWVLKKADVDGWVPNPNAGPRKKKG
jgi:excisionase family DNA binding protein